MLYDVIYTRKFVRRPQEVNSYQIHQNWKFQNTKNFVHHLSPTWSCRAPTSRGFVLVRCRIWSSHHVTSWGSSQDFRHLDIHNVTIGLSKNWLSTEFWVRQNKWRIGSMLRVSWAQISHSTSRTTTQTSTKRGRFNFYSRALIRIN